VNALSSKGSQTIVSVGVDVGASALKTAVLGFADDFDDTESRPDDGDASRIHAQIARDNSSAEVLALRTERIRRRDIRAVARHGYKAALAEAGVDADEVSYVASTGEGDPVEFRLGHFYGMTTHARGAVFLMPEVRALIDVGALHARALRVDAYSRVLGYRMTSQCASGSGQFLESVARYLGVALEDVGTLSCEAKNSETVSSICAVLAETDVINMVSRGIRTRDILKGIHLSMAGRFVKLLRAAGAEGSVAITGGLSRDVGLVQALQEIVAQEQLPIDIRTHERSIYAGAIGAALWGAFRHRKRTQREAQPPAREAR
jgi:benzoyl-CoA reductase subunit D